MGGGSYCPTRCSASSQRCSRAQAGSLRSPLGLKHCAASAEPSVTVPVDLETARKVFKLVDAGEALATPSDGLTLTIELSDPLTMARQLLTGQRPDVRIEGDAALAEVASWLMNHLRWDIQDDVARLLGNAPAEWLRTVGDAVRQTLQRWRSEERGPPYIKLSKAVRYPVDEIVTYEQAIRLLLSRLVPA